MNLHRTAILLTAALLLTAAAGAEEFARVGTFGGQFARIPVDARGEAMGMATAVNPAGPTAFWWNPAPLPESNRVMASYTIREYPADIRWRPVAVRASLDNVTFGYFWGPLRVDPMLVRTAYEPDGDGETFDAGSDLHLFSLAADVVPWLADGPSAWSWTLGANARYQNERLAEATASTWDADLGSSLAWAAVDDESLRLRLHGTAMVHNLFASEYRYENVTTSLQRYYDFGLGFEMGLGSYWRGERMMTVTVSHVWRRFLEDDYPGIDNEHLGIEFLLGGMVALRLGNRDTMVFFAEGWSWGMGLQYRFDRPAGLRLAVDYASTETPDYFAGTETYSHWTFSAGFDLP